MIAIQLLQVKDFMNKLLRTDLFDHFLLSEATIVEKVPMKSTDILYRISTVRKNWMNWN